MDSFIKGAAAFALFLGAFIVGIVVMSFFASNGGGCNCDLEQQEQLERKVLIISANAHENYKRILRLEQMHRIKPGEQWNGEHGEHGEAPAEIIGEGFDPKASK